MNEDIIYGEKQMLTGEVKCMLKTFDIAFKDTCLLWTSVIRHPLNKTKLAHT